MGITLSHSSALAVIRILRTEGVNIHEMDSMAIARPSTWVGKRWTMREFEPSTWRWPQPTRKEHLHVVVPKGARYVRMSTVETHELWGDNASVSALWVDSHASIVCPELLFLQMAQVLPLPSLVMLGYELCGNFSRDAYDPVGGEATINIPTATSVALLAEFLAASAGARGVTKARKALEYISDNALSPMEALLGAVYSLPPEESGYGMGPITLNERMTVEEPDESNRTQARYPDLSFSFAPVGLNYDGEGHLDLAGLVRAARKAALAEGKDRAEAEATLREELESVRAKVVDDNKRNRQLAACGRIVFPVTKEDVYGWDSLDKFTRQILQCAHSVFGINIDRFVKILEDTDRKHDRYALLTAFLPSGAPLRKDLTDTAATEALPKTNSAKS